MKPILVILYLFLPLVLFCQPCFTCQDAPEGTIFCDDFESGEPLLDRYFEYGNNQGKFVPIKGVGRDSSIGMRVQWEPNQVGAGGFKKSFGRTPSAYIGKHAVNPDKDYHEIYWKIDLRTQKGWQGGGGDKLMRAMTLARSNWSQGMIAHIWSGGPNSEYLGMDPASGIDKDGRLVSTKYNDFENLRWLGWKHGNIDLFSTDNSNRWFCIEAHVKLNTPGQNDGIFEFWINDTLQVGSYMLNWHGNWNSDPNNPKINAIFIENYWNNGSPVNQERYMDNFVISTDRIGCDCKTITSSNFDKVDYNISISPNPSTGLVQIKVPSSIAKKGYHVEFFNLLGQSLHQSITNWSTESSHDISNCDTKLCYYRLVSEGQIQKTGLILVENH